MQPINHPLTTPRAMTLLILEALGAMVILIGIVWWTMFAGRPQGERPDAAPPAAADGTDSADKK
jgi:hypothetical protein